MARINTVGCLPFLGRDGVADFGESFAAALMRNMRPINCHIRMLCPARETRQSGPGQDDGELYMVDRHGFLITTMSGIRPVLVQKKQVDQASANNGRLVPADQPRAALSGMTYSAPAPMPAKRSDLTVTGADKLGLAVSALPEFHSPDRDEK